MSHMDAAEIIKRFGHVEAKRSTIQDTWDLIEEYVTPYRGRFFRDQRDEHSIEWRNRDAWDSTAIVAHQNLSASLHGALSSPSMQWFDITFRDKKLTKSKAASQWIRDSAELVYYALQDSNFNLEVNEAYQDVTGFGTAFISQEAVGDDDDKWEGMVFQGVPLKEAYFEEDHMGAVEYFYRLLKWTPLQLITKFGEANVPEHIKEANRKNPDLKIELLFCIYPRKGKEMKQATDVRSALERPYGYKYVLRQGAEEVGDEGGYYEMPVFAPRWRKTSESMWGNSPAMFALSDILTVNAWVEILTIWSEKNIDPPILAEERSIITDLNLDARALTVVRNIEGIKAFETGANIAVSIQGVENLRTNIRSYFFTDQMNLPDPQAQPMTATEAQIRYETMQRLLGPTLGRLQTDMLNPIVQRTFNMLARAGELPEIPEILVGSAADMDIEYLGSLARSQRVDQAAAVERWVGAIANISPVLPEALDVADGAEIARNLGRLLNVDPTLMRDEKQVKALQDERAKRQADAQDAQQAGMEGDAAKAQGEGAQALAAVE